MTPRENQIKAIRFERPDYIPVRCGFINACYHTYPQEALFDLMESHPFLFPDFVRPQIPYTPTLAPYARKDSPFRDDFGCIWTTAIDGLTGTVTGHPLASWDDYANYQFPDPSKCMGLGPIDWAAERARIEVQKAAGHYVSKGLRHGHTFLQLCDLRGYQNAMFDMLDGDSRLVDLLDKLTEFNRYIVQRYAAMGVDAITYAEDLGMQRGPMLKPVHLRQYIMPCYQKLMQPAKDAGITIHMHSDGDIRKLLPTLLECGVDIINLQDLVNGIDWIRDNLKGKVCVDLDVDRQKVTAFGTPKDVDALILEEVKTLGSREGGLMLVCGIYPGIPLENIKALLDALEKYAFYYA